MREQSLNGFWERRVGYGKFKPQQVPYSTLPVGHSECKRTFDLSEQSEKVFLRFDGITYYAKVLLNGKELGEMLPYSEYVFDITDVAKEKDNELLVLIEDTSPTFGPSEGWENYGGIIRGVSLLYSNASYVKDAFFSAKIENDYQDGKFKVALDGVLKAGDFWRVTLLDGEKTVCAYEQKQGEVEEERLVKNVQLWSPENPYLYTLQVEIVNGEKVLDEQVLSYTLDGDTLRAELPLSERLGRSAKCAWSLNTGHFERTEFTLCARASGDNADGEQDGKIDDGLIAYAFFESVLIGANYAAFLSDELAADSDKIVNFLGDFLFVTLTDDPFTCGLVRKKGERLFSLSYYRVKVQNGKIIDVNG